MISVEEFVLKILKKKGWSLSKFADEINKVRKKAGLSGKAERQNISNCLNKSKGLGIKTLIIWEKALGLKDDSLCSMVKGPTTLETKRNIEELKKRVRNI